MDEQPSQRSIAGHYSMQQALIHPDLVISLTSICETVYDLIWNCVFKWKQRTNTHTDPTFSRLTSSYWNEGTQSILEERRKKKWARRRRRKSCGKTNEAILLRNKRHRGAGTKARAILYGSIVLWLSWEPSMEIAHRKKWMAQRWTVLGRFFVFVCLNFLILVLAVYGSEECEIPRISPKSFS